MFVASGARVCLLRVGLLATLSAGSLSQAAQPVLFFSDLVSGPNSGGQNNNGAFVTLYGNHLGSTPTVKVGGGQAIVTLAPAPYLWYQKMTIQLGPQAQTGTMVVSNPNGSSNGLPFTVRPGKIYFVAPGGRDFNSGSFTSPWKTLPRAVQGGAGSIVYAMDGVSQTSDDGQGWGAAVTLRTDVCQGTAASPKALIAYPGATVTIGNPGGASPAYGLRSTDFTADGGACGGNWVLAGITFRGVQPLQTAGPSTNWRIVGNDVSNPQAGGNNGGGSALGVMMSTYAKILGNNGHDLNLASTDRLQQAFYPGTDSNHLELGWNMIANAKGRAGIQIHSSPLSSGNGYAMYDISIHDNVVHDIAEEGILVDTIDPSKGPVTVYNNLIYNVGLDGQSNGAIYRADSSDYDTSHGAGAGTVDIYNNTILAYKAGPAFGSSFEVHTGQALVDRLRNNLILSSGDAYFDVTRSSDNQGCSSGDTGSGCPNFTGSNNLVYGAGAATFTNLLGAAINVDPKLVSAHLQSGSPAIAAGVAIQGLATDLEGNPRPQAAAPDIGAYQYSNAVLSAAVNGASYAQGPISPGEVLACFGSSLAPDTPAAAAADQPLPTELGGTRALFDGIAGQMWYVQENQIDVSAPLDIAGRHSVNLVIEANGLPSAPLTLAVQQAAPGVFALDMSGQGQAVALNEDGTLNSPANPVARNSTIRLYATGLGQASVTVEMGGVSSEVRPSIGLDGVFEVDARVPATAPVGPAVPLVLAVGNAASQAGVTLAIK